MNFFSQLTFIKLIITLLFNLNAFAKVEAPNYSFSLDSLEDFMPGKNFAALIKKYPKYSTESKITELTSYKVYIDQLRFKFPVIFQVKDGIITDFYARLPSYFLHDIFHQSLINRNGKQNKYFKKEEAAVYIWTQKDTTQVYSGACTITCFPVYYSVFKTNEIDTSIFKKLNPN